MSDPDARVVRARLALDRGDEPAARAMLLEGPADHAGLARFRGRMALTRRDVPAAISSSAPPSPPSPTTVTACSASSQAFRLAGKDEEAGPLQDAVTRHDALVNLLQRAASSPAQRGDPQLLRDLGTACEALGLIPEARAWYGLAIARDPTNSEAQVALHRLGKSGRQSCSREPEASFPRVATHGKGPCEF